MRFLVTLWLLLLMLTLSGCASSLQSQPPPQTWTTGFWFWEGSSAETASSAMQDVIFVQVGSIRKDVYGYLPDEIPAAREYWLVFRYEQQGVPDLQAAPLVGRQVAALLGAALKRHLKIAGVQLDIDSPTRMLPRYAEFLRDVRKSLPSGCEISITALLDWFRDGTSVGDVIREVDEFVPQFYDVAEPEGGGRTDAIALKIDAGQWGPKFNRFEKRYRIGISSFGRASLHLLQGKWAKFFNDVTPLDIAMNPSFTLATTRNAANELVLSYRATRKMEVGYNRFEAGDVLQFILATPEAVREAVESAKRMGGYCGGIVFFRWPFENETLTMQPDEVLAAAGLRAPHARGPEVRAVSGGCAAVSCMDLYLEDRNPRNPQAVRYRIRSSVELQYFLPEKKIPVRMADSSRLEVSVPPYCSRPRMYLGRAVSDHPGKFTVEEEQ